jgi:hypothetical protein
LTERHTNRVSYDFRGSHACFVNRKSKLREVVSLSEWNILLSYTFLFILSNFYKFSNNLSFSFLYFKFPNKSKHFEKLNTERYEVKERQEKIEKREVVSRYILGPEVNKVI